MTTRRRLAIDAMRLRLAALVLLAGVALPGCGGCRKTQPPAQAPPPKPKPPYEAGQFFTQPSGLGSPLAGPARQVKPGHWASGTIKLKANRGDFNGELSTRPEPLDQSDYRLLSARPAILPKEQAKDLEIGFFVPTGSREPTRTIATRLSRPGGSGVVLDREHTLSVMPAHKFHLLVLAKEVDRYRFLDALRAINNESVNLVDPDQPQYYQVLLPRVDRRAPLANNPLEWTSLAYVVWDDFDTAKLTGKQREAMLDWLHWGGQLIVSGPASLAGLRGSFLEPYLPATGAGAVELGAAELAELASDGISPSGMLTIDEPWAAERLAPAADAEVLLASAATPLAVDRRVGRGRIVVTAFDLAERSLVAWPGNDPFWNECLLRRPPRDANGWADGHDRYDPARVSRVRLFARDAASSPDSKWRQTGLRFDSTPTGVEYPPGHEPINDTDLDPLLSQPTSGPGVCGWDDFNTLANSARDSLQNAAEITIPDGMFVLKLTAIYLAVLVPVNWLIFRLIGRVEWAWVAVPVIAIVFAVVVVRLAQLDIGFVRARTELGVVELYAGYPRAHLTRFTALYSSLSTSYDAEFSDDSAAALPFPSQLSEQPLPARNTLIWRSDARAALEGFRVASNSTGMVRSEQVTDIGGTIELVETVDGSLRVTNNTPWTLKDAGVVGPLGRAWIGELEPGAKATLDFQPTDSTADWAALRKEARAIAGGLGTGTASDPLAIAETLADEDRGAMRLVAWTDEPLKGMTIQPEASQGRFVNLVVAHLQPAPLPEVRPADERNANLPPPGPPAANENGETTPATSDE